MKANSLPDGWLLRSIGELAREVVVGHVGPSSQHRDEAGVPFLMGKNVREEGLRLDNLERVSRSFHESQKKSQLSVGDVVVVRIGKSGTAAEVPATLGEANCAGLVVIKAPLKVEARYLVRYLNSPAAQRASQALARGSTRDTLNTRSVEATEVLVPPLPEQRRIADILDRADAIRRKRKEAIALTEELLRSAFLEMFGDPVTNPKGWEVVEFKQLLAAPLRNGLSPATDGKHVASVLTLSAITRGAWDASATKLGAFAVEPWPAVRVDERDFLICRGNGNPDLVGAAEFPAHSAPEVVFPDTMIAARVDARRVRAAYLRALWRTSLVRSQLVASARTTNGTYKVNQTAIENILVLLPSVGRQERYEALATKVRRLAEGSTCALEESETLFGSLVHRAFRGGLTVRSAPRLQPSVV